MRNNFRFFVTLVLVLVSFIVNARPKEFPPPDLLKGEKPITSRGKEDSSSFNVGATGFYGWCYHKGTNTSKARQILVKVVDKGSPSDGKLAEGDIILGADGTGSDPSPFVDDARKTIAEAIGNAEALDPASLKLLRWRKGKTDIVTLTLETMGTYSPTAPYDCEKSKKILSKCLKAFYESDNPGTWNLGLLVLLAADDPNNPDNDKYQAKAKEWARNLILPKEKIELYKSDVTPGNSKEAWPHSYILFTLAEYYLKTKDPEVFPTLEAYAICYAKNQSWFGTTGHQYARKTPTGGNNGPMAGYGAINGTGVTGFIGMLLARKAGVKHPALDPAIRRAECFFASYATKSGIPYGEHCYGLGGMYDMNGKNSTVALAFMLMENRVKEAKFFARMAMASSGDRQDGHAGPFFNYLWPQCASAAVGKKPIAHYFSRIKWLNDLDRKWNGEMAFSHFGHSPKYRNFSPAVSNLLTYTLPLRQLYITGRDQNELYQLTEKEIEETIAAEDFKVTECDLDDLVLALGNWAPQVRGAAIKELTKRYKEGKDVSSVIPRLRDIAKDKDANPVHRNAAAVSLGNLEDGDSASMLADLLTDSNSYVRYGAANSLRYLPRDKVTPQLDKILKAAATTIRPTFPLNDDDPLQFAHHQIAMLLFYNGNAYGPKGLLSKDISGVKRELLWPAVRAVGKTPSGQGRSTLGSVYPQLSKEEVKELGETIVDTVKTVAPADAMFAGGVRMRGADILQKYNFMEGVPLSKDLSDRLLKHSIKMLQGYKGSALRVDPDPDIMQFIYENWMVKGNDMTKLVDAIVNDPKPAELFPLKKIDSVKAAKKIIKLPAKSTTLNVSATNYAKKNVKDTFYTWRKIYGPGKVKFTPNGTWESRKTTVDFVDAKRGKYKFEVTMADAWGYSVVRDTVEMYLCNSKGQLPRNYPPVAGFQSVTASAGIPLDVKLTGNDPEKDDIAFILASQPSHGTLSGTAPNLKYKADYGFTGSDRFDYNVVDGQGVAAKGKVSIDVIPAKVGLTVYEGFDYPPGKINGKSGESESGLVGKWESKGDRSFVEAESLSYSAFPSTGGKMNTGGWSKPNRKMDTEALTRDGILKDGKELWFSIVLGINKKGFNRTNAHFWFGLRGGEGENKADVGFHAKTSNFHGTINRKDGTGRMNSRGGNVTIPFGKPHMIIGHCKWGKTSKDPDTVEIYRVLDIPKLGPVLLKEPVSVMKGVVSQEKLDTLYFDGNLPYIVDEIRIGPSYRSVLLGTKK